jgi:hypothetical protein
MPDQLALAGAEHNAGLTQAVRGEGCIKLDLANAANVPGRVDGAVLLSSASSSS